tara:strand:- start:120 stop:284 length:165 start_codon:yes stop_codon:yes gene_type:complete
MKKFLLIAFIFLISCSQNNSFRSNFIPSDDMSFDEFRLKLDDYAKSNPYPNIDD